MQKLKLLHLQDISCLAFLATPNGILSVLLCAFPIICVNNQIFTRIRDIDPIYEAHIYYKPQVLIFVLINFILTMITQFW